MDQKKQQITGIILAGGDSKRMGKDKGLLPFRGKPMVCYAIEALKPLCNHILISANSAGYEQFGYPVIPDERPDSGPMGGIWSCMKHAKNELCFVLSCDMPLVDHSVVSAILDISPGFEAVVPWYGESKFEPLCALYKKSLLPKFEKFIMSGNFRIPDLINRVNSHKIRVGGEVIRDERVFFNVNSPDDLQRISFGNPVRKATGIPVIPNLLMIAGTGRKVGKTTFACHMIRKYSKTFPVTAIKISPHLHHQIPGQKVVAEGNDFVIIRETNANGDKDSSRMLHAGAAMVFYLQIRDQNIREPFQMLLKLIPDDQPVICESGALLSHARPGLFLLINRKGEPCYKKGLDQLTYHPDMKFEFDGERFFPDPQAIVIHENKWKLRE